MSIRIVLAAVLATLVIAGSAEAQNQRDVFKGKLFPPNVILEHQGALDLTREQFTQIRAAVVDVQANVAEHEWDMREAYLRIREELDKSPIDADRVLEMAGEALAAENEIKKQQMAMLIALRNLLTDEQIDYLRSVQSERD